MLARIAFRGLEDPADVTHQRPVVAAAVLAVRLGWKLVDAWLSRKYVVFEGDDLED